MKFSALVLSLSFLIIAKSGSAQEASVFLEDNGRIVMEVESVPAVDHWTSKTEITEYTGTSYYEWTGPEHFNINSAGEGILTYTFRVTNPGNYELRWRSRIAQGSNGTESNDSWLRFATGTNIDGEHALTGWTKGYMNQIDKWSWIVGTVDHVGNPIRQYFDAGDHTLEISGRSNGHAIDRMVIFQYETINYTKGSFDGFAESTTVVGSTTPDVSQTEWSTENSTIPANACSEDTLSLTPSADVQVENGLVTDTNELWVDSANKKALMKFDLSTVPAPIVAADLSFSVGTDSGSGSVVLSTGNHSDWSENDIVMIDGPDNSVLLGSFTGIWQTQERYSLPFDQNLLSTTIETMIVEMSSGADGISINSRQEQNDPRLRLTGNSGFCEEYDRLVAEAELNVEPDPVTEPVPEETEPLPDNGQASAENPSTNTQSGSMDYLVLLLLLCLTALRLKLQYPGKAVPAILQARRQQEPER